MTHRTVFSSPNKPTRIKDKIRTTPMTKVRARAMIISAVRAGFIIRPEECPRCGKVPKPSKDGRSKIQAHHLNGYDDPYDFIWLCTTCHGKEDFGQMKGEANGWCLHSDEKIRSILERLENGETVNGLARKLGMSRATIQRCKKGMRTWRPPSDL